MSEIASGQPLGDRIRQAIQERGPLTFAEFMEISLYDPEGGFYATNRVGEQGDFVTSPHVSAAFGVLVARQVEEFWTALGRPDPFWVVEGGAGDGTLGAQLLDFLPRAVREAVRYVGVERSARGRASIERRGLRAVSRIDQVETGVTGCVIANELLDNLPFHRVRGKMDGPVELFVGLRGDRFALVEGQISSSRVGRLAATLPPGMDAVIQPDALGFVDHATALLERGYLWLADYGFTGGERASGPHAYRGHRLDADVLSDPGSRDITAGVDFEALVWHLRAGGHTVWGPVTQRDALLALGYRQLDEEARQRQVEEAARGNGLVATRIYASRGQASSLIDPGGLGGFLVLAAGVRTTTPPMSVAPEHPRDG